MEITDGLLWNVIYTSKLCRTPVDDAHLKKGHELDL